jgi:hypothetical protein
VAYVVSLGQVIAITLSSITSIFVFRFVETVTKGHTTEFMDKQESGQL